MNPAEAQEFLSRWVAHLNVRLDALDDAQRQLLDVTGDRLVDDEPVALPFLFSAGPGYLCAAPDPTALRRFREDVTAFVGPTYADIEPGDIALPLGDAQTRELALHGYSIGFRLRRAPTVTVDVLRNQLLLMCETLAQAPPSTTGAPRSLGHLLRDFDWAVRNGDSVTLDSVLASVKLTGELSEDNQRFLEVQRFAALEEWEDIWKLGLMAYMLDIPRPQVVTDLLLEAIWHKVLIPAAASNAPEDLADTFRREVGTEYWPLFISAQRAGSPVAQQVAALFAVTSDPQRGDILEALLQRSGQSHRTPADPTLEELAALLQPPPTPPPPASSLELAIEALDNSEFDRALSLLDGDNSLSAVRVKIIAAFELDDCEAALQAVTGFEALNDSDKEQIRETPSMRRRLDSLSESVAAILGVTSSMPSSLAEWIEIVEATPEWPDAVTTVEVGTSTWEAPTPTQVQASADRLAEIYASAPDSLLPAVPHLLSYADRIAEDTGPATAWPLWRALFESLVLDDHATASDLAVVVTIFGQLLSAGPSAPDYADIVDTTLDLWIRRLRSYEHLDWAIEALDALARNACPDPAARLRFLSALADTLVQTAYRLRTSDVGYVRLLYAECGEVELLAAVDSNFETTDEPATDESKWTVLEGKTLGLHCLFAPISRRFAEMIARLVEGRKVEVEVDDSRDCSPRLRALCEKADVVVVVTQHAKHAGTECVDRHAKPPTVVLKSRRARIGFSGVLQVLEDYVDDLVGAVG
ncbi:protein DpdD [Mycolicibacterium elephantis]|uniref:protein DpdD n=1 Tax=Mycolicibacterium elephantis TaxID=81858 RepID=UPI000FE22C59|nr:protein DpdD [Mycolicibacterium elephantis]MCV7220812.1 hypothetical protein [Mycolicibacterium elephantis]